MTPAAAHPGPGPTPRPTARVLLLDAAGRVLLLHGCDPDDAAAGDWWFTPGGGLEPGESPVQGAVRELEEETGLRVSEAELGEVVHRRVTEFAFAGGRWLAQEAYFLARVDHHEVDTAGFTDLERAAVLGHRWWTEAELAGTAERYYPPELLELLARAA